MSSQQNPQYIGPIDNRVLLRCVHIYTQRISIAIKSNIDMRKLAKTW